LGVGLPTVEERDLVAASDGVRNHRWTDQSGSTEDQDLQFLIGRADIGSLRMTRAGDAKARGAAGKDRKLHEISARSCH
jgi:hypothetical protein